MNDQLLNIENLKNALNNLRNVRDSFVNFLKNLTDGPRVENEEDVGDSSGQKLFFNFRMSLRELEKAINILPIQSTTQGGNYLDILALDPSPDKLNLYHQILDCYTWTDKVSAYSGMLHSMLNGNHLKRTSIANKRKRIMPMTYDANAPMQNVDMHINSIKNMFAEEMTINITRPCGINAIVHVTLGRVFKSLITFRGLLIEGVIIRGYNEQHIDDDGKVDVYKPSEYEVFQKVTDNATAAMLHFSTPGLVDLSIRSFFTWLNSYSNLFTEPCKKCACHIRQNFPPTWREFKTLEAYHEECRP